MAPPSNLYPFTRFAVEQSLKEGLEITVDENSMGAWVDRTGINPLPQGKYIISDYTVGDGYKMPLVGLRDPKKGVRQSTLWVKRWDLVNYLVDYMGRRELET